MYLDTFSIITVTRAKQRINMCISVRRCNFIVECMLNSPVIHLNFPSSKGWHKMIGIFRKRNQYFWKSMHFCVKKPDEQHANKRFQHFTRNKTKYKNEQCSLNMLVWLLLLSTRVRKNFSVSCFTLNISTWIDLVHVTTLNIIYLFADILGKR